MARSIFSALPCLVAVLSLGISQARAENCHDFRFVSNIKPLHFTNDPEEKIFNAGLAPDSRSAVAILEDGNVIVYDLQSGEKKRIPTQGRPGLVQGQELKFSPDGERAVIVLQTPDGDPAQFIVDLRKGTILGQFSSGEIISNDVQAVFGAGDSSRGSIQNIATGHKIHFKIPGEFGDIEIPVASKEYLLRYVEPSLANRYVLIDPLTGKMRDVNFPASKSGWEARLDQSGEVLKFSDGAKAVFRYLKTGKELKIETGGVPILYDVSQNGDWIYSIDSKRAFTLRNARDGRELKKNFPRFFGGKFSSDGKNFIVQWAPNQYRFIRLSDFSESGIGVISQRDINEMSGNGDSHLTETIRSFHDAIKEYELRAIETACVGKSHQAASYNGKPVAACANSWEPVYDLSAQSQQIEKLQIGTLCFGEFNEQAWDAAAPIPKAGALSEQLVQKLLLRFQRAKGFDPAKHLPVLVAILESDWPSKRPDLVGTALLGVLNASPAIFEELVGLYPKLRELTLSADGQCGTSDDRETLKVSAQGYFFNLVEENNRIPDYEILRNALMVGKAIGNKENDSALRAFKYRLIDEALKRAETGASLNYFPYVTNAVNRLAGGDLEPEPEFQVDVSKRPTRVFRMSSLPIRGSAAKRNSAGFFMQEIEGLRSNDKLELIGKLLQDKKYDSLVKAQFNASSDEEADAMLRNLRSAFSTPFWQISEKTLEHKPISSFEIAFILKTVRKPEFRMQGVFKPKPEAARKALMTLLSEPDPDPASLEHASWLLSMAKLELDESLLDKFPLENSQADVFEMMRSEPFKYRGAPELALIKLGKTMLGFFGHEKKNAKKTEEFVGRMGNSGSQAQLEKIVDKQKADATQSFQDVLTWFTQYGDLPASDRLLAGKIARLLLEQDGQKMTSSQRSTLQRAMTSWRGSNPGVQYDLVKVSAKLVKDKGIAQHDLPEALTLSASYGSRAEMSKSAWYEQVRAYVDSGTRNHDLYTGTLNAVLGQEAGKVFYETKEFPIPESEKASGGFSDLCRIAAKSEPEVAKSYRAFVKDLKPHLDEPRPRYESFVAAGASETLRQALIRKGLTADLEAIENGCDRLAAELQPAKSPLPVAKKPEIPRKKNGPADFKPGPRKR